MAQNITMNGVDLFCSIPCFGSPFFLEVVAYGRCLMTVPNINQNIKAALTAAHL